MQNQNQNITGLSSAVTPQIAYKDIFQQLDGAIQNDIKNLFLLIQQGVITKEQGQSLLAVLESKSKTLQEFKQKSVDALSLAQTQNQPQNNIKEPNPLDLFNEENPDFFANDRRLPLLEYLKGLDVDKDEIFKIAQIAKMLEDSAIDGYLKKSEHDKNLNDENLSAKSRLTSYAQNASSDKSGIVKPFTREEIGKMSGDEFVKNEKLIMEQVKLGLIK